MKPAIGIKDDSEVEKFSRIKKRGFQLDKSHHCRCLTCSIFYDRNLSRIYLDCIPRRISDGIKSSIVLIDVI